MDSDFSVLLAFWAFFCQNELTRESLRNPLRLFEEKFHAGADIHAKTCGKRRSHFVKLCQLVTDSTLAKNSSKRWLIA
ncbi:MAG: hypothetical protein MUD08_18615, partial [Cytophagales bacterium]|nr:hypothetical protein [Cytophagales bacterium]